NELMARGINLQAISVNGWLDFNVYIFNVQPGYTFDYATGRAKVARDFSVGWVK
ncbi:MAG: DNA/RNA non-specific endonuclease, partial [Lactobacillus iners]|nr:DNA/RNA non-specific endonuclease [Lactobacillus iners]